MGSYRAEGVYIWMGRHDHLAWETHSRNRTRMRRIIHPSWERNEIKKTSSIKNGWKSMKKNNIPFFARCTHRHRHWRDPAVFLKRSKEKIEEKITRRKRRRRRKRRKKRKDEQIIEERPRPPSPPKSWQVVPNFRACHDCHVYSFFPSCLFMEVPRIVLVLSTDEGLLLFYFPVVTCDFRNKI